MNAPPGRAPWLAAAIVLFGGCGGSAVPPGPVAARSFDDPGFVRSGEFEMRYGLLLAGELDPAVAEAYDIDRRPDRVVLSVSVLRLRAGSTPQPVEADLVGSYRSLTGEAQTLAFRRVLEQASVSYVAEFPVRNREAVIVEFESRPADGAPALRTRLTRTFETR